LHNKQAAILPKRSPDSPFSEETPAKQSNWYWYVGRMPPYEMPGISPFPAPSGVVYHSFMKKYTRFCEWIFTDFGRKVLHLLVEFAIIAGIVWITMAYGIQKEAEGT